MDSLFLGGVCRYCGLSLLVDSDDRAALSCVVREVNFLHELSSKM